MKITKEFLELLYGDTCQSNNGYTLEDCLKNVRGERMDTVYALLDRIPFNGGNFGVFLISSDGGVQDFFVTYKFGEFSVLVCRFINMYQREWPFDSIEGFAEWLNNQEKKILATATLMVTP